MVLIDGKEFDIRVSSVLNKDVKQYGKQFLIDGKSDTCWNSDQGNNQWIECNFKREVRLSEVNLQFQGGFSANKINLQFLNSNKALITEIYLYPEDKNDLQIFNKFPNILVNSVKFIFNECTDFFGRIIVYKLELFDKSSSE